ncbi:nucleotidyl transferase AbiEii/AbiGii toxin family protein [bacterium]|nr:nucleotidyl transferase AbiEii/AbiGii toxin family protein [bacterium]
MRDYVLELVATKTGFNAKLNIMREYLQACILRIMHDNGVFRSTAFLGGTALRFLYNLPRFSEDLDFSSTENKHYTFADLVIKIKQELKLAGYDISVSYNDEKTVRHAMVKFDKLMYEAGISPHKAQKFSIKIEIDTNPPEGADLKTDIVNKYFPISFLSYDIPSLFAGKFHALLSRKYTKGRDFFDLGWYLSRWKDISPNIAMLQNALKQTGWTGEMPSEHTWRDFLYTVVKATDWQKIEQDVGNFLENPSDMNIFTKKNVLSLLQ